MNATDDFIGQNEVHQKLTSNGAFAYPRAAAIKKGGNQGYDFNQIVAWLFKYFLQRQEIV